MTSDEHAMLLYRVGKLEEALDNQSRKTDRLIWALVTLTITIGGSCVVFALTVASIGGRGP